jgi:hypothetical protein
LYGYSTGYIRVQASVDATTRVLYLRDHGVDAAYAVATTVTSAVGSSSLPVYISNKGVVTTVSKVIFSNTASGTGFAFTESRTEGSSVSFGVGSGNVNHGIYSNTLSKWIAYADTTGVYLNGNANTATALKTGRTLKVTLGSTNASTAFNGEANVHDIGVSGTLAVGNGGTGLNTLTSGYALIGNGTSAVSLRPITNNTSKGPSGWSSSVGTNLITHNTLAYWNGAYSGTSSNLSVLGTVTTGTWNASIIGVSYAGTGTSTAPTAGGVIYGSSATAYGCTAAGTSG